MLGHYTMHRDYTPVTELPGALLTPEQYQRFVQRYALAAAAARNRRVLEVACGAGNGLAYVAQQAAHVVGMDYSGPVLQQAAKSAALPWVQGDAHRLPFATDHFDLLLCFEAIYYLHNPVTFLEECRRVLAVNGLLTLCQTNPDWPDFVPGALSHHYLSGPDLLRALKTAGFGRVRLYGALPIAHATARRRLAQRARRLAARTGLLSRLRPLAAFLQRLSHGTVIPLPRALEHAATAGMHPLTPLAPDRPDRGHQVLYALAWA